MLSLFDLEKKKLAAVRSSIQQSDIENAMSEVTEKVDRFMHSFESKDIFLPIKAVEIEAAYALSLHCAAQFQQTLGKQTLQCLPVRDIRFWAYQSAVLQMPNRLTWRS